MKYLRNKEIERQTDRQTDRLTDRERERERDRQIQTERQSDIQTVTEIERNCLRSGKKWIYRSKVRRGLVIKV